MNLSFERGSDHPTVNPITFDTVHASNGQGLVRRALLIGIHPYKNENLNPLPGTENDIKLAEEVLTRRFGFSPDHIRTLKNERATRKAILDELRQLVEDTAPQDVVYIHFSGHGSQVEDLDGDERGQDNDKLDETLVPYDGRTPGVPDITDDELDEILSLLKTNHAVIVLDSCHSGTATRGTSVLTRRVPQDLRVQLYRKNSIHRGGEAILPSSKRYILLAAARADQEALDAPIKGTSYGVFSYSFFRSLKTISLTASARETLEGTESELKELQPLLHLLRMPEPQLEGPEDRLLRPLFPPLGESTRLQWLDVKTLDQEHIVLVRGKLLEGLPGSHWALYHSGEINFSAGKEFARAVVLNNEGDDAVARLTTLPVSIPTGTRAVKIGSGLPELALVVRLRDGSPKMREALEEALRQRGVRVVGPNDFAPFVVDATTEEIRISGADGQSQIDSFPITSTTLAADSLAARLRRSSKVSQLLALENPSTTLQLKVGVYQGEKLTRGVGVFADMDMPKYRIRRQNQSRNHTNSLQLKIWVDQEIYLTVVDVDSEGKVNMLFPNKYSEKNGFYPNGRVPGAKTVLLPDDLRSGNRAGFHWDYIPPSGEDMIRIFASTDLKSAETIRQFAQNFIPQERGTLRGGTPSAFAKLNRKLIQQRGIVTVPADPEDSHLFPADWTAASVSVVIKP